MVSAVGKGRAEREIKRETQRDREEEEKTVKKQDKQMTKLHIKQKAGRMHVFAKGNYQFLTNRKLTRMTTVFSSMLKAIGTPLGVLTTTTLLLKSLGTASLNTEATDDTLKTLALTW